MKNGVALLGNNFNSFIRSLRPEVQALGLSTLPIRGSLF